MIKSSLTLTASICTLFTSTVVSAEDVANISDIFAKGDAGLSFRYRLETVDQDGFEKNATASTLLTKLWYKTATYKGFSGYLEATNTTVVGKETFNSTVNGNLTRPIVPDPEGTELNQAYLRYKSDWGKAVLGRQSIGLDNQRFIGVVGFRQNDQTYDAVLTSLNPTKEITSTYAYIWNVNRIFGNDHPLGDFDTDTHIFNIGYEGFGFGKLSAYGYFVDLNDAPVLGLSSKTFGLRFSGKKPVSDSIKVGYQIEYAKQSDYKDNPFTYSANYWHTGLSVSTSGFTIGANYEVLGSDGGTSFKTPLATLHKFNGWADKFLTTPTAGLQDTYFSLAYKVPKGSVLTGIHMKAVYHDFKSDVGGVDYGSEWDFLISKKLNKTFTASVKAALYSADTFATSTNKVWVTVLAKF